MSSSRHALTIASTSRSSQGRRAISPSESGGEGGRMGIRRRYRRVRWSEVTRRHVLTVALVAALAAGGVVAGLELVDSGSSKAAGGPQQQPPGTLDQHP